MIPFIYCDSSRTCQNVSSADKMALPIKLTSVCPELWVVLVTLKSSRDRDQTSSCTGVFMAHLQWVCQGPKEMAQWYYP